jgi:hypothetical protein
MVNEKRLKTCGDCIHADICKQVNSGWFSPENIAYCKAFKDKADYVELPCRPRDHVFRLCGTKKNRYVGERIVSAVTLCGNGSWTIHSTAADALDKTVFLTREEAEKALAKMDGDGNGRS